MSRSSGNSRPGGRSARVVEAVLQATLEELAKTGWSGFQVEAVAARAGVHKTTVYRRWPTRGALVAAAVAATPFRALGSSAPDTGSLRGDVGALLDDVVAMWDVPRTRAVTRTLVAARHDPEVAEVFTSYWAAQVGRIAAVVARAQARGEAPETADPELVAEVYLGTTTMHLVELDRDPTPGWIAAVIDITCAAASC